MPLEKTLRTRDLVLFNVAAIVGMRWVALAAHSGPSSIGLWILAAFAFFVPQGLCVTALCSAIPEEGGLYVWAREAFGPRQGFVAGWLYWTSNILYFPTLTLSTVVFALYVFNLRFAALENNRTYAAGASLVLLAIGIVALASSGSATPITTASLLPSFARRDTIIFFAQFCFGFAGLELAPMMAGAVHDPKRTFPRAIWISGLTIAACYILGTMSLLWALPPSKVSIIAGVNQAIAEAGARHGMV